MLDENEIRFGGPLTAHGATRIAELLVDVLEDYEGDVSVLLMGINQVDLDDETPSVDEMRGYLLKCIKHGRPAVLTQCSCTMGEGGWKTDAFRYEAERLQLSGRFSVGNHSDGGSGTEHAFAVVFGPDAPDDGHYLVDDDGEPLIKITEKTDLRGLPREAERLLELAAWKVPPLTAHGDLLDELQELEDAD